MNPTDLEHLVSLDACSDGIKWAPQYPDLATAWREGDRGDYLIWYAARIGVPRPALVLCACEIARQALKHVPRGELRPLRCIETAERWARGEATLTELYFGFDEASEAGVSATEHVVSLAADAAYYTARAVLNATAYAASVAHCVAVAERSTLTSYYLASLAASADIVRRHFTTLPRGG